MSNSVTQYDIDFKVNIVTHLQLHLLGAEYGEEARVSKWMLSID